MEIPFSPPDHIASAFYQMISNRSQHPPITLLITIESIEIFACVAVEKWTEPFAVQYLVRSQIAWQIKRSPTRQVLLLIQSRKTLQNLWKWCRLLSVVGKLNFEGWFGLKWLKSYHKFLTTTFSTQRFEDKHNGVPPPTCYILPDHVMNTLFRRSYNIMLNDSSQIVDNKKPKCVLHRSSYGLTST